MVMNLDQYREWLRQELVDNKNILDEAQWLIVKAEQGISFYNKALALLEEVKEDKSQVASRKSQVEESSMTTSTAAPTEENAATPRLATCDLEPATCDRTPAQMIASKYKEYSIPTAIEVYLNTLNGGSATVDEIELELFDLQDGDSDVERKKIRATLSTVLSTGMSKKKFTKVSKGNWSIYKADIDDLDVVDGVVVDERGDIPVANTVADVDSFAVEENTSFLEEGLVSASSNSKHY